MLRQLSAIKIQRIPTSFQGFSLEIWKERSEFQGKSPENELERNLTNQKAKMSGRWERLRPIRCKTKISVYVNFPHIFRTFCRSPAIALRLSDWFMTLLICGFVIGSLH
jgi:hypothetical protein